MNARLPFASEYDDALLSSFEHLKEVVAGIRTVRKQKQILNKEPLKLFILGPHDSTFDAVLIKMGNLDMIELAGEKPEMSASFIVGAAEYCIPLEGNINTEEEIAKLEKEKARYEGFLAGVRKKLGNERFVSSAPEKVVALERKKESDTLEKLAAIESSLKALRK